MAHQPPGNLFDIFRGRFPPDLGVAFITLRDGRTFTYGDLDAISARYANFLVSLGIGPGDRVLAQVEKSPEAVFLYLGCLRAGAVFLPLNTAYRSDEIDYFLSDAAPSVVIGDPGAVPTLEVLCATRGVPHLLSLDATGNGTFTRRSAGLATTFAPTPRAHTDLAAILYSSGTTGRAKGVMLTHGNFAANAQALHQLWRFGPDDVLLHALPIFHTHGLFVAINTVLMNGTGMIFHPRFHAEDVIADMGRATVFMGVPTYYVRLAASPALTKDTTKTMRLFLCGSAPLLDETFRNFEAHTGKQIVERYGMTETGIITSADAEKLRCAGSVGWPLPSITLRIADGLNQPLPQGQTGEIQISGPNIFAGYWQKPDKTADELTPDGFFKTGDLAYLDADGMVNIVGRAKDMMISGGFNVYPREIEAAIDALPGVAESAVIGMPHPDFGEAGLAIITMGVGAQTLSASAVRAMLKEGLANYKVPKVILFADNLPRNAMGKVQKNLLRANYRPQWDAYLREPRKG